MSEFKMTSSIAGHTATSRSAFCMRVVTERRMGLPRPRLVLLGAALVLLAATADSFAQVGACCIVTGPNSTSCGEMSSSQCAAQNGGTYSGDGSLCANLAGACVLNGDECEIFTQEECEGNMGSYQGCSTVCPSGACCDGAGGCSIMGMGACNSAGSTYWGDGTNCAPGPGRRQGGAGEI